MADNVHAIIPRQRRATREQTEDYPSPADIWDRLPFVTRGAPGQRRDFWAPRPTGDYTSDNRVGGQYADAFLALIKEYGSGHILATVVIEMMQHGDLERDHGVIVGMFFNLGEALERGLVSH